MEIQLKHLTPYLPYGLKVNCDNWNEEVIGYSFEPNDITRLKIKIGHDRQQGKLTFWTPEMKRCKPILKPLSDLNKEIDFRGDKTIALSEMCLKKDPDETYQEHINRLPYCDIVVLLEMHFDIFGLIDKGYAVDNNTL